ncbi:DNA polymerase III subunit chi [Thiohalocapsa marina]|uniref:DNA polymerase III subunit chi n=1 Tax=Thiohalocapsa marina TaxID=424902 RepID=A0A5M8FRQ2_9GAMM|nr:DNA polymerase III subunit chi [Thiohalocapsa marina]KAA6185635.1 DNA polymerase III subunit chi [Thiohalocapsa marina]
MTRIDFYVIKPDGRGDRFALTCRLVERIYPTGMRILIHCPDPEQMRHLDRLLWTYREDSFLPHGIVGETDPALTPILISADGQPADEDQVLINLAPEVPEFFSRFERLCEPVDNAPDSRAAGRRRYSYYRDCGYPLHHHAVSG